MRYYKIFQFLFFFSKKDLIIFENYLKKNNMNKLRLIIVLAFFVSLLNFTSCENEPIDPAIDLNPVVLTCAAPVTFTVSDFINSNSSDV